MKASQFTDHEQRITRLEVVNEQIFKTLERLEKKIDQMDSKFDQKIDALATEMHQGFKDVNTRIDGLNSRIWSTFFWQLGALAGVLVVMAKGFHWY